MYLHALIKISTQRKVLTWPLQNLSTYKLFDRPQQQTSLYFQVSSPCAPNCYLGDVSFRQTSVLAPEGIRPPQVRT